MSVRCTPFRCFTLESLWPLWSMWSSIWWPVCSAWHIQTLQTPKKYRRIEALNPMWNIIFNVIIRDATFWSPTYFGWLLNSSLSLWFHNICHDRLITFLHFLFKKIISLYQECNDIRHDVNNHLLIGYYCNYVCVLRPFSFLKCYKMFPFPPHAQDWNLFGTNLSGRILARKSSFLWFFSFPFHMHG